MSRRDRVRALLDQHGETFAEQAGITLADKPSPLFRLLVLTSLLSANLDARLGLRTARALNRAGFTTARHLAEASDRERWQVLNDSRYLRKKQTSRQLGALANQTLDRYTGDLRRLPYEDVKQLRAALQDFTGIGAVGADIFCREVQAVWPGLRPYVGDRVAKLAATQSLPRKAEKLAELAGTPDLSRLGAALVTADMLRRS